jgi:hypothetical protein
LFDLLDFLLNCHSLSLSLSPSGEKFQSLSNQIRTVHWINTWKKMSFMSHFLSNIDKKPPIPRPSYDYPPIDLLLSELSVVFLSHPFYRLSLSSLSSKKKKNDQYSLLDWTCWIFFQCFPFIFGLFCARHLVITHDWKTTKKKWFVDLLPYYSTHSQTREKWANYFSSSIWKAATSH